MNIFIEGSISSGKSYFLTQLTPPDNFIIHHEPIQNWGTDDINYLREFYHDPHKNAYPLQKAIYRSQCITFLEQIKIDNQSIHICERGPFSSLKVFCYLNIFLGNIRGEHRLELEEDFHNLMQNTSLDATIYFSTTPRTSYLRTQERQRIDAKASYYYHYGIGIFYHNYIQQLIHCNQKVVVINSDAPLEDLVQFYDTLGNFLTTSSLLELKWFFKTATARHIGHCLTKTDLDKLIATRNRKRRTKQLIKQIEPIFTFASKIVLIYSLYRLIRHLKIANK